MVPDLIWAPDFFGPREIWPWRNLVTKKFVWQESWSLHEKMPYNEFHAGTKFLEAQIHRGQNFLGSKKVRAHMISENISVIAITYKAIFTNFLTQTLSPSKINNILGWRYL